MKRLIKKAEIYNGYQDENDYYECFVNPSEKEKITSHIDSLNKMDFETLRKLYKESLFKTTLEDFKAELGLIDIAKTSKNPLQYLFSENMESGMFYSLMVDF